MSSTHSLISVESNSQSKLGGRTRRLHPSPPHLSLLREGSEHVTTRGSIMPMTHHCTDVHLHWVDTCQLHNYKCRTRYCCGISGSTGLCPIHTHRYLHKEIQNTAFTVKVWFRKFSSCSYWLEFTITRSPISVQGVSNVAVACVRCDGVVAILCTLVCLFQTLILVYEMEGSMWGGKEVCPINTTYHHSCGHQHSVCILPYSCKCRSQQYCGSSGSTGACSRHIHQCLQTNQCYGHRKVITEWNQKIGGEKTIRSISWSL